VARGGVVAPTTVTELSDALRDAPAVRICGSDNFARWRCVPVDATDPRHTELRLDNLSGIVDWSPSDQVVTVRAGTNMGHLQCELGTKGQCIPIVEYCDGYDPANVQHGTVGGRLSTNLPHELEHATGNWRDWVLGMRVVLADGTAVRCGSHAVKNVAGYDLQKLFVGARGALGVVAEVTLRTFPTRSLPEFEFRWIQDGLPRHQAQWIQRVLPADFRKLLEAAAGYARCEYPQSSTLWAEVASDDSLPRYPGDWVIRSGCGEKNVPITNPTQVRLMKRAKQIFDPENKLNPGEWGFL
jgi:FAD/FMN-containing dehydrogenase